MPPHIYEFVHTTSQLVRSLIFKIAMKFPMHLYNSYKAHQILWRYPPIYLYIYILYNNIKCVLPHRGLLLLVLEQLLLPIANIVHDRAGALLTTMAG